MTIRSSVLEVPGLGLVRPERFSDTVPTLRSRAALGTHLHHRYRDHPQEIHTELFTVF